MGERPPWNANIHHHPVVLEALPAGAQRVLDVGCGDGFLTRDLRTRVPHVIGLDRDQPSLDRAREAGGDIAYVRGDVLRHPFAPGTFDLVSAVASLHHMDERAALQAMADLVRPGGVVAVVGLAARHWLRDLAWDSAGFVAVRYHFVTKGHTLQQAPMVWPPRSTFGEVERLVTETLPGATYRRHVLFRWSLVWTKPAWPG